MSLEKHGTAKFPMEEVTGLDQALLPAVQRLIDDGYLFAHPVLSDRPCYAGRSSGLSGGDLTPKRSA